LSASYVAGRATNPKHRFDWQASLYDEVKQALGEMTQMRCAYCDGDLRAGPVQEEIDHFRPKSQPEFYALVCAWDNLFLVCGPCNKAKGNRWELHLLKPDEIDYDFARYFSYSPRTGELEPNPGASEQDIERARVTIKMLGLNRGKHCTSRMWVRERLLEGLSPAERDRLSYRFLMG
jgi:uncharacterized protein (TIGR02646 family)